MHHGADEDKFFISSYCSACCLTRQTARPRHTSEGGTPRLPRVSPSKSNTLTRLDFAITNNQQKTAHDKAAANRVEANNDRVGRGRGRVGRGRGGRDRANLEVSLALVAAADDDSVDDSVPGCLCGGTITNLTAFVACDFCEVWYHRKCVGCDTPEAAER